MTDRFPIKIGMKVWGTFKGRNVKSQSLDKQLRLQRKISNDNGTNPILRINRDAHLTDPLIQGEFDIQFYNQLGMLTIESNQKLSAKDLQNNRNLITKLEENQKKGDEEKK